MLDDWLPHHRKKKIKREIKICNVILQIQTVFRPICPSTLYVKIGALISHNLSISPKLSDPTQSRSFNLPQSFNILIGFAHVGGRLEADLPIRNRFAG
jgi:hypothetical protein